MEKYIGIKLVEAEEMKLEDFQLKYPGRVISPASGDMNNGYCVTYPDGYQGWCPKEVFEASNIKNDEYVTTNIIDKILRLDLNSYIGKIKLVQDDSCHWYAIPNILLDEFNSDLNNENFEAFDDKYNFYRLAGDANTLQLYTTFYID